MKKLTLIPSCITIGLSIIFFFFPGCKKDNPVIPTPASPVISNIVPQQDTTGAQIVINGTDFSTTAAGDIVKFGKVPATVVFGSTVKIVVIVPEGAYTAPISVSVNGVSGSSPGSFTVTGGSPSVDSFSLPVIGVGYTLTIYGKNFSEDNTKNNVTFNGVASNLLAGTTSQINASVPLTATSGKIVVMVNGKTISSTANITIKTATVTSLAGGAPGHFNDGAGTAASFYGPTGIVCDGSGNCYVADEVNNRIRKVNPDGLVTTFAGTGEVGSINGPAETASFAEPSALAFDSHGNLFVSCHLNHNIRKITPDGIVSTFVGDSNGAKGYIDATGTDARFNLPMGMVIDRSDNIFVADAGNNLIRKITPDAVVSTFAGSGASGSHDSTALMASFNQPTGLGIDGNNNLYILEPDNRKIRKINSTGLVTTFAGTGESGWKDDSVKSAKFFLPIGIAADAAGNVFVTDEGNMDIRMITTDGIVLTLAGSILVHDSIDGIGGYAGFSFPYGITVSPAGIIYITDSYSGVIRKMVVQ
jgi:serine/threonine protein kinase, bacterial